MRLFYSSLSFALMLCGAVYTAQAQEKLKEHIWTDQPSVTTDIPDSLKKEDAIMVYQHREIRNESDGNLRGKFYNTETVKRKIKIQTDKGLADYSIIYITKSRYQQLTKLDARTIKANGNVVDLNTSDIKRVDIAFRTGFDPELEQLRFSIPGVETGDEIELIYTMEMKNVRVGGDVHLYSYLPTLRSTFTFTTNISFFTDFKTYNGLPKPLIENTIAKSILKWNAVNLPAIGDEDFSCYEKEIPYLSFALRYITYGQSNLDEMKLDYSKNNWGDLYNAYLRTYENRRFEEGHNGTSIKGYLNAWNKVHQNEPFSIKLYNFFGFIRDSIKVVDMSVEEGNKSAVYYISKKQINTDNLYNLYKYFLDYTGANYYIGMGRNKYKGVIDMGFASPHVISDVFFVVETEDKQLHYLYPSYPGRSFELDELPNYLLGTEAVLVSRKNDQSLNSDVKKLYLDPTPPTENYRKTVAQINVNLKDGQLKAKFKETFSGDYATFTRNELQGCLAAKSPGKEFLRYAGLNRDVYTIDTVYLVKANSLYPFIYNIAYDAGLEQGSTKLGKDVHTIPLGNFINHYTMPSNDKARAMAFYPTFRYFDSQKLYFVFDTPVALLNKDKNEIVINNEAGAYTFTIRQMNDKMIMVESQYEIGKNVIPATVYPQLHQVNNTLRTAQDMTLMVKPIQ
jgi:hypothetical protein